ncbi:aminopeptidase P family protein [Bartonella bacilliformis]|uniref:Peptidase, M24 family n=2 Tax=Bartonella bacilliformis TaxID=774 RepID=A1UTB4_BARBK|nr:aminopeptidase P family protein [Bartonella bacilliformis]ABM45265.1 peptidase, M24 family [Bartonella bacilliformis KC583]AMG85988.1 aminopeptidase P family protein [Bartonella bacilliformis]EKS43477.1 aminopeptidase [Bartonella bacilliformis INS]KZN21377.1 X-Pro aminopeptidase [Bartonella bacilliformis]QFZ90555.1 M24 family metallopeptidase [Bartonella bacilliformis]
MYQSFEAITNPTYAAERISALRIQLNHFGLDGFLVPRTDEHQGEYIPLHAQRLSWLTGFTGSAGIALILKNKAIIFTDGRYTLQVRQQTDPHIFDYEDLTTCSPSQWLEKNGQKLSIGFDPWLHTISATATLKKALEQANGKLIESKTNLIDLIWHDQPPLPQSALSLHPLEYAGRNTDEKLALIRKDIQQAGANAFIFTDPASIAWTFNIRGNDISNTPFALCFALIPIKEMPILFIDGKKLGVEQREYLKRHARLCEPEELIPTIKDHVQAGTIFALDPTLTCEKLRTVIEERGSPFITLSDPASLPRAIKNNTELNGARKAHLRDGLALIRFLSWLDKQISGTISEISAAQKLEEFRIITAQEMGVKLEDLSFDTISATGEHGAIIHYRVTTETNKLLNAGELYLVDSGGQYRDGTTDVTRTVAIDHVGGEEKRCFTLVLKGMIALSTARFPKGTRGQDIDVLARIELWKAGFDYAHGTGHGVGSYLSVHEGPQNLSCRGSQELIPGMIVSNEPGYYREGAFGIRIENLMIVKPAQTIIAGDIDMLSFKTLTNCPIDRRLILPELLTIQERQWLNDYHTHIYEVSAPYLNKEDRQWLKEATMPL